MNRWQVAGILIAIGAGFLIVIKTSHAGVSKIMIHEALRLKPYKDVAGHWTIGYGHKLLPGEWYDEITKEKAEQLLRQDLAAAENAVNLLVRHYLCVHLKAKAISYFRIASVSKTTVPLEISIFIPEFIPGLRAVNQHHVNGIQTHCLK